jgi:hypothetical protein
MASPHEENVLGACWRCCNVWRNYDICGDPLPLCPYESVKTPWGDQLVLRIYALACD